jgi:hypothetical protein
MTRRAPILAHVAYWAIMLLLLVSLIGRDLSHPPSPPGHPENDAQAYRDSNKKNSEGERNETIWERTRNDPTAYFTFWLVIFTGVLAVSTIGLWLVTGTAARAARDSADVAAEQVKLAKETAARQLRAYVHLESITMFHANDSKFVPIIVIKYKNFGVTPALRLTNEIDFDFIGEIFKKPESTGPITKRYADVGPSQDRVIATKILSWNLFYRPWILKRVGKFVVFGEITYFDAFQNQEVESPRVTRYRMYIRPDDVGIPDDGGFIFDDEGNEAT